MSGHCHCYQQSYSCVEMGGIDKAAVRLTNTPAPATRAPDDLYRHRSLHQM